MRPQQPFPGAGLPLPEEGVWLSGTVSAPSTEVEEQPALGLKRKKKTHLNYVYNQLLSHSIRICELVSMHLSKIRVFTQV